MPSSQSMTHVAWNCNGKKLAAVGIDKSTRVWSPEKSMELRAATVFSGGHSDNVNYISWNPAHPELFCMSSQKDRRIVFWDARPMSTEGVPRVNEPDGCSILYASAGHQLFFMTLGKTGKETKEEWHLSERDTDQQQSSTTVACKKNARDLFKAAHNLRFNFPATWESINLENYPLSDEIQMYCPEIW
ncbi:hypothetical protein B0H34DRAFT_678958 [Crassisporium funariophilum]|nr:hypothetical protein B0H34DRAFT_678958 [Crassisporium funariophilum]